MAMANSKLAREGLPSELAMDQVIQGDARALSGQLQALREKLFPPEAKKTLRRFSSSEAARLIGVTDSYLRHLAALGRVQPLIKPRAGVFLTRLNKSTPYALISPKRSLRIFQIGQASSTFRPSPLQISRVVQARQRPRPI